MTGDLHILNRITNIKAVEAVRCWEGEDKIAYVKDLTI